MDKENYPERGHERYYLIAGGSDYDNNIREFGSYEKTREGLEKLSNRIKELLGLRSNYFKGNLVPESAIHVIYGREIPWSAEKELVHEVKIGE